ncbi:hypothetical protein ACP6PL_14910 [Dapis sp. BLCC M126]|uniref:hypothetical protein n=1 Tax=Dapis sp. BLCC M126 TaxID=3400189 RepID=UPI003CF4EB6C
MVRITIRKKKQQAEYYIEDLGNNVELAMVKIPGGNFLMGSPEIDNYLWLKPLLIEDWEISFLFFRYP